MAYNVPAIEQFINDLNAAANSLLEIREDLNATDRLWAVFDVTDVDNIRAAVDAKLTAAKAQVNALTVP